MNSGCVFCHPFCCVWGATLSADYATTCCWVTGVGSPVAIGVDSALSRFLWAIGAERWPTDSEDQCKV